MPKSFKCIIFDCDGVLIDSEVISIAVNREHLSRIGLHYSLEEFNNRFVGMLESDYLIQLNTDCMRLHNKPLPVGLVDEINADRFSKFEEELQPINGIVQLLQQIEVPVAVASSSTSAGLAKKMKLTKLKKFFEPYIFSGQQVANGKLAPDLFLLAADQLGFAAHHCIVIEDSINGVHAGVAAGMETWGFVGGGHADHGLSKRLLDAGAARVFECHSDILNTLM